MKLVIQDIPGDKLSKKDRIALEKSEAVTSIEYVGHTINLVLPDDDDLVLQIFKSTLNKARQPKTG